MLYFQCFQRVFVLIGSQKNFGMPYPFFICVFDVFLCDNIFLLFHFIFFVGSDVSLVGFLLVVVWLLVCCSFFLGRNCGIFLPGLALPLFGFCLHVWEESSCDRTSVRENSLNKISGSYGSLLLIIDTGEQGSTSLGPLS